ncbi:MAG: 2'-5' RNA ligase family protein [Oscillatoria sp. PMC 1068.18]|nr:2'-5' RNA ligase family protein [Oscillatoria sp. PMC 1076.18]MEC4991030.1 2'-5' RNA ligase family protein [Oscillatoria sp. PMC 1068.18]
MLKTKVVEVVSAERLFFIALLPPPEVQQVATKIKEHFAEVYNSRHALNSPPHITLQSPFKWLWENLPLLETSLAEFAGQEAPIPVILDGFGAFPPRVIYINPLRTPELIAIQQKLTEHLRNTCGIVDPKAKSRPFAPHVTVAFKDLTKSNFRAAWNEYQTKSLNYQFTVPNLTLLLHNNKRWEIQQEFPFQIGD